MLAWFVGCPILTLKQELRGTKAYEKTSEKSVVNAHSDDLFLNATCPNIECTIRKL